MLQLVYKIANLKHIILLLTLISPFLVAQNAISQSGLSRDEYIALQNETVEFDDWSVLVQHNIVASGHDQYTTRFKISCYADRLEVKYELEVEPLYHVSARIGDTTYEFNESTDYKTGEYWNFVDSGMLEAMIKGLTISIRIWDWTGYGEVNYSLVGFTAAMDHAFAQCKQYTNWKVKQ